MFSAVVSGLTLPACSRRCLSSGAPRLFRKKPISAKQHRLAASVREALAKTLASGVVKDRGMANGHAVYVADVQVESSGYLARVLWEPMNEEVNSVETVRAALERKKGLLRHHVNSYIDQRVAVQLEFVPLASVRPVAPAGASPVGDVLEACRADLASTARRRAAATAATQPSQSQVRAAQDEDSDARVSPAPAGRW